MAQRYQNRPIITNDDELYEALLEKRHIKKLRQYASPHLRYPTVAEIGTLTRTKYIWKTGDRYYKLADRYYGSPRHWWIIAFYNQKPTEAHVKTGDILYIPLPLERILQYLEM